VRFDRHLEDTSLRWVRWDDGRYSPFVPPAVGDSIRLPAPIGPFEMSPADLLETYREARAIGPQGGRSPRER